MTVKKVRVTLAVDGGRPVRKKPLPAAYLGTSVLGNEELRLLTEVIRKKLPFRDYGDGTPHMVNDFEQEARRYFGVPYALATATGSGSFYCAMAGLGVGPGDEVIIPSFGWFTDFEAPVMLGAVPVFADIDRSLCLDPDDVRRKITKRTRAIIYIHFQGGTGSFEQVLALAQERGIRVVEDVAQGCGGTLKGAKLGSLGDVACFSFQQNKILSTGDGGLLLTRDPLVFERAVRYHDLGFVRKALGAQLDGKLQVPQFAGSQFRMNEFIGAVALAQLRKLDRRVLDVTRRYHAALRRRVRKECRGLDLRPVADEAGDAGIAFFMDLGSAERANWFSGALKAEGIRIGPSSNCTNILRQDVVRKKLQVHPALPPFGTGWAGADVVYDPGSCPNTDSILAAMVCVAMTPTLSARDVRDVGDAIVKVWGNRPRELFS